MKRRSAPPAKLIPLLLGCAGLVLVTWHLVRADVDVPGTGARTGALQGGSSSVAPDPAAPERHGADGAISVSAPRGLAMPVAGVDLRTLHDSFAEARGGSRSHEALDIPAPRGTPVLAAGDGVVRKLFTSVRGGLTVYEFDPEERYCYYYAHLDEYAPSLHEGQVLRRGELVGYVGSTGNAREDAPHLHFAVTRLDPDRKWWGGTPIDPYPLLVGAP